MEHPFKFKLDPFQEKAIEYISKDENVLITAKTGSGKTLVGEYQIWRSLNKGKRVFYTTPIKSLSNQKFHDLKKIYGDDSRGFTVGIMTGDIKFCPQADIVIMTTEILRNLLYKQGTSTEHVGITAELSLANLDAVVFDEVHYINDHGRGSVWEECLVLLPPDVNLVLLSATLDSPEPFVNWLTTIKQKPCHLISTEYRIVPLIHMTEDGEVIMDPKDQFNFEKYKAWVRKYYNQQDELRKHKERVKTREEGQVVEKDVRVGSFLDRMNKLIVKLDRPALFFVFSRKMCEEYASKVSTDLLTSSETADVKHIVKFHLHKYTELQKIEGFHKLNSLLEKGVAFHHSGMLPILKEIVEVLFDKGFIKILFATETFAVGINMPTKSVVFTSYRKYDDLTENMRMLRTSEYIQMAGRAGRRGKDDKGIVVYLPIREPEDPQLVKEMMTGKRASVESQMKFDYSFILATMGSGKSIQNDTYWMKQNTQQLNEIKTKQESIQAELQTFDETTMRVCEIRDEIQTNLRSTNNADKKKHQQELSKWDNSHVGPKWDKAKKEYVRYGGLKQSLLQLDKDINYLQSYLEDIETRKSFLFKNGYIDNNVLTEKGILASEIHEGHPILMTELYTHEWIRDECANTIVKTLSCFLEQPTTEEIIPITQHIDKIRKHGTAMMKSEILQTNWEVTDYWHDVMGDWLEGNDFVCEKYGVEHGNFVRATLKLANIVREWVSIATIKQDTAMIEKMIGIEQKLVRGFVIPDSLYLRI
jgi:superfamily II RNA helicase